MLNSIAAVVVTYRRPELLSRMLTALENQTRKIDTIIVVDNNSGDETSKILASRKVQVITLKENAGGAGGFTVGIKEALQKYGADYVWIMDDDTIPEPLALEKLEEVLKRNHLRLAASKVVWTNGEPHPMNMPKPWPFTRKKFKTKAAQENCYPIRSASFVSILIERQSALQVGLPVADYFLWNDDFEYTTRLIRGGTAWLVKDSIVVHHTKKFGGTQTDPGERFRFEVRNKIWLLKKSNGLNVGEKIVYMGATLKNWALTAKRSNDRETLLQAGKKGLLEGISKNPRPNETVLKGALHE